MPDILAAELFIDETKANAAIKRFRSNLAAADKDIEGLNSGSSFAKKFEDQLNKATAAQERFQKSTIQTKQAASSTGADARTALAGRLGLGVSVGTIVGGAIGTGVVIGANESIAAAKEAQDSLRVLKATAKETGIEFGNLKDQAVAFGKETGQSNNAAQRTFAQIVNFANAAGRSDKLEEFRKRFADLAAAKGINAGQLGDISRQLNALTDEATDKLLNANPSAFYAKFAASIGKTADSLTDAEKRAAVFDEVLKKGAIFSGEAEERAKGFSGQVDTLKANIENLKTTVGEGLIIPINFLVNAVNTAISGKQGNDPNVFFTGLSNALFSPTAHIPSILNGGKSEAGDQFAAIFAAEDAKQKAFFKQYLENYNKSKDEVAKALAEPNKSLQNFAFKNFLPTLNANPVEAEKQKTAAIASAKQFVEGQKSALETAFKSGDVGQIKEAVGIFNTQKALFEKKDFDKLAAEASAGLASTFQKVLDNTKAPVSLLRKTLKDALAMPELKGRDRSDLIKNFTERINQSIEQGKAKLEEYKKAVGDLANNLFAGRNSDNPFVKVYSDAEKAIQRTIEATRGLSKETQELFLNQTKAANARALFDTRLDTGLQAINLRDDADTFRRGDKGSLKDRLNAFDAQNKTEDERRKAEEANGIFRNPDFIRADREKERARIERDSGGGIQERLQKQIDFVQNLARTPEERASADRKIIGLTQGLDAKELTSGLREEAAAAREREATRLEKAEADSKKEAAAKKVQDAQVASDLSELLKIVKEKGVEAVEQKLNITVKSEDGIKTRATRADSSDVEREYQFSGFGFAGGSNR